ncbi:RAB5 Interacting Factor [Saguinus oedipus]|uniref:RAB5 Interacting Factor n=1 Tax=Saguinus oedipus TaxID=9490 RepID=A0ABQ9VNT9_SAGOE|nr:RAB5 Interacting Factor [Saguinus oedipus]
MSGGRRKEEPPQPQLANGALKVSVWSKVLRSDAAWEDKVRWSLNRARVRGAGWDSGNGKMGPGLPSPPFRSDRARGPRVSKRTWRAQGGQLGLGAPRRDEFLDVIYWFRQIIAVVLGVIWGVLPLRGFLGIAGFCLINAGVLYLYFSNYLQIDEEEYGGTWELTKEGFMTSFALFMQIQQISCSLWEQ